MLTRVRNPRRKDWPLYGGRGVTVVPRWFDFDNFLKDMGERPEGKTLDRYPNKDGNYEPGNCRWATPLEQVQNRRKGFFRGERNNQAALSWKQVRAIRKWWDEFPKQHGTVYKALRKIATRYQVSFGCVMKIVYKDSWKEG